MLETKLVWKSTPFSRELTDHEGFVKTVVALLSERTGKKYKIDYTCHGFDTERVCWVESEDFKKFHIQFAYLDCIPLASVGSLRNRVGRFLDVNGYEFNPVTNAIIMILHEVGHVEYITSMVEHGMKAAYKHIYRSNNSIVSMVLQDKERGIWEKGINLRYMLSGEEMYCDGFAMTYFRAVANELISKGFPEELLHLPFNPEECVQHG